MCRGAPCGDAERLRVNGKRERHCLTQRCTWRTSEGSGRPARAAVGSPRNGPGGTAIGSPGPQVDANVSQQ